MVFVLVSRTCAVATPTVVGVEVFCDVELWGCGPVRLPGFDPVGGEGRLHHRFPVVGQAPWVGAVGHLFAARGGMECCDKGGRAGSISRDDRATGGGHDISGPAPDRVCGAATHAAGVVFRARM